MKTTVRRVAGKLADAVREMNEAQRLTLVLRTSTERYLENPDAAPGHLWRIPRQTSGALLHEPPARKRARKARRAPAPRRPRPAVGPPGTMADPAARYPAVNGTPRLHGLTGFAEVTDARSRAPYSSREARSCPGYCPPGWGAQELFHHHEREKQMTEAEREALLGSGVTVQGTVMGSESSAEDRRMSQVRVYVDSRTATRLSSAKSWPACATAARHSRGAAPGGGAGRGSNCATLTAYPRSSFPSRPHERVPVATTPGTGTRSSLMAAEARAARLHRAGEEAEGAVRCPCGRGDRPALDGSRALPELRCAGRPGEGIPGSGPPLRVLPPAGAGDAAALAAGHRMPRRLGRIVGLSPALSGEPTCRGARCRGSLFRRETPPPGISPRVSWSVRSDSRPRSFEEKKTAARHPLAPLTVAEAGAAAGGARGRADTRLVHVALWPNRRRRWCAAGKARRSPGRRSSSCTPSRSGSPGW